MSGVEVLEEKGTSHQNGLSYILQMMMMLIICLVNKTINTQKAGLWKSNHNVPSLIPLPLSVIRFSRHSWRTERNSGIPAKVFHSQSAAEFWCCFKMQSRAPSLLKPQPHIANASFYCVCVVLLQSVWSVLFLSGWPLTSTSARSDPTVTAGAFG